MPRQLARSLPPPLPSVVWPGRRHQTSAPLEAWCLLPCSGLTRRIFVSKAEDAAVRLSAIASWIQTSSSLCSWSLCNKKWARHIVKHCLLSLEENHKRKIEYQASYTTCQGTGREVHFKFDLLVKTLTKFDPKSNTSFDQKFKIEWCPSYHHYYSPSSS